MFKEPIAVNKKGDIFLNRETIFFDMGTAEVNFMLEPSILKKIENELDISYICKIIFGKNAGRKSAENSVNDAYELAFRIIQHPQSERVLLSRVSSSCENKVLMIKHLVKFQRFSLALNEYIKNQKFSFSSANSLRRDFFMIVKCCYHGMDYFATCDKKLIKHMQSIFKSENYKKVKHIQWPMILVLESKNLPRIYNITTDTKVVYENLQFLVNNR